MSDKRWNLIGDFKVSSLDLVPLSSSPNISVDHPPDKQEKATQTVLEQAKLLCGDWAEAGVEVRDSETFTTDDENLRAIEKEQKHYNDPR